MRKLFLNSDNFFEKFNRARGILLSRGISGLKDYLLTFLRSNFKEKWEYIYFDISLDKDPYSLPPLNISLNIRVAKPVDIPKIESDIYPLLTPNQENDKRYISRIGEKRMTCFIAEQNHKIVHYFLVFENALDSPLMKTPFDKVKILENDAYLGSTFTAPDARGLWIVPHTLLYIFSFLRNTTNASRALLLVHKDTPGAVGFYCRLGFKLIEDTSPRGLTHAIFNKLSKR